MEIELQEEPPKPASVEDFAAGELPDYTLAERRRAMVADVAAGVLPATAAASRCIDAWEADPVLVQMVAQAEACARAVVERRIFELITKGQSIPAPMWYWLEARAGYDRKDRDDGLPQEVHISRKVVRGDTKPGEE